MDSKITINIVEPGSGPTPDPVVPNTGLFTSGIGGPEATAIGTVLVLTIAAIVVAVCYRKQKKSGKVTKLVHIIDSTKAVLKSKKRITAGLSAIALLASAGTLTTLLANAGKSNTNAIDGEATAETETITPTVSGNELTVELGSEPVFAVLPVELTVEEATQAGYTLTAYTDNTDLVSTTDSSKVIPMVTVDEGELTALADNTYGLALAKPETKDEEAYTTLSTDADNPTFITDKDYEHTDPNDTTTIYYGFYITPDVPYGTYTGSDVTYAAIANPAVATVTFDGNGLYFNGDESQTTNTVKYVVETTDNTEKYSHTPNITDGGVQEGNVGYKGKEVVNQAISIPGAASVKINLTYGGGLVYGFYEGGWASIWQGLHPNYTAENDYGNDDSIKNCGGGSVTNGKYSGGDTNTTVECDISGDSVTFAYYAQGGGPGSSGPTYGYYAIVTGYDADGNIIYLPGNIEVDGEYKDPSQDLPYIFLGWNEDEEATTATYKSKNDIELNLPLAKGETTELYAIWQHATKIHFDGNGADSGTMDTQTIIAGETNNLNFNTFTRDGYSFNGWNTSADGTGESYPNQGTYIAPVSESQDVTLYAQWKQIFYMQDVASWGSKLEIGDEIIAVDNRDNKEYYVARLADGNIWMTQNLDLDLSTNTELTPANTNISSNWTPANSTISFTGTSVPGWQDNSNVPYSADPRDVYYYTSNTSDNDIKYSSLAGCKAAGHTDCAHYHAGNYYNWSAAVANNNTAEITEPYTNVETSICPAGWRLPKNANAESYTDGNEQFTMISSYDGILGERQPWGAYNYLDGGFNAIRTNPLWLARPGYVHNGSLYETGGRGDYWSSTVYSSYDAYRLPFFSRYVSPASYDYRYYGYPVRCIAQ